MKNLEDFSRKELDYYMIDCHGFDPEEVAEWETKEDLCCDIRSSGREQECLDYLG